MDIANKRAKLLGDYPRDKYGIWHVTGEDPNCDLGGHHHDPDLGYFEGRYEDMVNLAIGMKKFFSWGAGGKVTLIEPVKVDNESVKKRDELRAMQKNLSDTLRQVTKELNDLE